MCTFGPVACHQFHSVLLRKRSPSFDDELFGRCTGFCGVEFIILCLLYPLITILQLVILSYQLLLAVCLGIIHYFQHFHKSTEATLRGGDKSSCTL